MNSSPDIKIFLIGNKSDLEDKRVIDKSEAEKYKKDYDLDYFTETSAKTGMNVNEIFIEAAKNLYDNYMLYRQEKKAKDSTSNSNKKLSNKKENKKKKCC